MKELMTEDFGHWLKDHHRLNEKKVIFDIVMVWLVIALALFMALTLQTWWATILAILIIGSRQHALGTLVHDGTHFTLFKNRVVNDLVCDVFCAFPIFISTRGFRIFHLTHHRYTRTEKDPEIHAAAAHPDYIWPKSKWGTFSTLFRDLVGINALSAVGNIFIWSDAPSLLGKSKEYWMSKKLVPGIAEYLDRTHERFRLSPKLKLFIFSYYIILFTFLTVFGFWKIFLLYWVVPLVSVVAFLIRLRGMSEHNGLSLKTEIQSSRTTVWSNPIMGYLVTPFYVNYHLEHHLYPQVPYFHLKLLHEELMKKELYKTEAAISRNYLSNLIKQ